MNDLSLFTLLSSWMKFPHFSRIITAQRIGRWFNLIVLFFLLTIVLINIVPVDKSDTEERLRNQILKTPFTSSIHEELGSFYLKSNREEAQREFQLAQELYLFTSSPSVLGVSSQPLDLWNTMITMRENILAQKTKWESIATLYPDYTYAYMKIAEIEKNLGNEEESKRLIEKIRETSPLSMNVYRVEKGE